MFNCCKSKTESTAGDQRDGNASMANLIKGPQSMFSAESRAISAMSPRNISTKSTPRQNKLSLNLVEFPISELVNSSAQTDDNLI